MINLNMNDIIYISGDSYELGLEDYNVRVSSYATVLDDSPSTSEEVFICLDEIDGDKNVNAFVNKKNVRLMIKK